MITWPSGTLLGIGQWQFGFQMLVDRVLLVSVVVSAPRVPKLDGADEMWRMTEQENCPFIFSKTCFSHVAQIGQKN